MALEPPVIPNKASPANITANSVSESNSLSWVWVIVMRSQLTWIFSGRAIAECLSIQTGADNYADSVLKDLEQRLPEMLVIIRRQQLEQG